jgi:hypothetical protein
MVENFIEYKGKIFIKKSFKSKQKNIGNLCTLLILLEGH